MAWVAYNWQVSELFLVGYRWWRGWSRGFIRAASLMLVICHSNGCAKVVIDGNVKDRHR